MNARLIYLAIFLICGSLLGYGFYLQYVEYLEPCPLCMVQRLFFLLIAITALIAAIHGPVSTGRRFYSGFIMLFSVLGGATSSRQVWLQHLPPDQVPECGPGLSYMIDTMPWLEVARKVIVGTGDCAEVVWTFLGLSIPEWALVMFVTLFTTNLVLFVRAGRKPSLALP